MLEKSSSYREPIDRPQETMHGFASEMLGINVAEMECLRDDQL